MGLFDTIAKVANQVTSPGALLPPDIRKAVQQPASKAAKQAVQAQYPVFAPEKMSAPEKDNTVLFAAGGLGLAIIIAALAVRK